MPRPGRLSSEFRELQRQQLDERLRGAVIPVAPRDGWIRAIREALGMSLRQFATRLGMTPPSALDLETREQRETISIARLRAAADALDCDLHVVFTPRTSLADAVQRQAQRKARAERDRVAHTMTLEAQSDGVHVALDDETAAKAWRTTRARQLWDESP